MAATLPNAKSHRKSETIVYYEDVRSMFRRTLMGGLMYNGREPLTPIIHFFQILSCRQRNECHALLG